MKGTEKQVKWAKDIKAVFMKKWQALQEKVGVKPPAEIVRWIKSIESNDESRYWIDNWSNIEKLDMKKTLLDSVGEELEDAFFDWVELGIGEED